MEKQKRFVFVFFYCVHCYHLHVLQVARTNLKLAEPEGGVWGPAGKRFKIEKYTPTGVLLKQCEDWKKRISPSRVKRSKARTQRSQTRAKRQLESAERETAEGVKKAAAEAEKKEAAGETEQVCCEEEAPYWLEVSADCPPEWETVLRHQMLNKSYTARKLQEKAAKNQPAVNDPAPSPKKKAKKDKVFKQKVCHWNYIDPQSGASIPTKVKIPGPAWDTVLETVVLIKKLGTNRQRAYAILQPDGRKRGKCHLRACTKAEILHAADNLSDTDSGSDTEDAGTTDVWGRLNHVPPLPSAITNRIKACIQESGVKDALYKFVERVAQVYNHCHDDQNSMHEDRDKLVEDSIKVHLTDIICCILRTLLFSSYGLYVLHVTDFICCILRTLYVASYGHYKLHLTDFVFHILRTLLDLTDFICCILRTFVVDIRSECSRPFRSGASALTIVMSNALVTPYDQF